MKVVSDTSAFAMNQCFTSALDIAEKLNASPEYNTSGTNHRTLLVLHCCASYEQLPVVLSNWNLAWKRSINDNGKDGDTSVTHGLHLMVMSYCANHHPYLPTQREQVRTTFATNNGTASLLVLFECLPRTVLANRQLTEGDHCHNSTPQPIIDVLSGCIADEDGNTTVNQIQQEGASLMVSGRSEVIACIDETTNISIFSTNGNISPRLRSQDYGGWNRIVKKGARRKM